MASMSVGRDAVGVAVLGDKLFAVGGYDGQQYLNIVECYDPLTNEWTKVSRFYFSFFSSFSFSILLLFLEAFY